MFNKENFSEVYKNVKMEIRTRTEMAHLSSIEYCDSWNDQ